MYHFFDRCETISGDALVGWQIEIVDISDLTTVIPIFCNEAGTPIINVSGVANRAVSNDVGEFEVYVPEGKYGIRYYDASGVPQATRRYMQMYAGTEIWDARNDAVSAANLLIGVVVSTVGKALSPNGRYSIRTSLGDLAPVLPALSAVNPGAMVEIQDLDFAAATHNQTITARSGDTITYQDSSPASTFPMTVNGVILRFVSTGSTWRASYYGQ